MIKRTNKMMDEEALAEVDYYDIDKKIVDMNKDEKRIYIENLISAVFLYGDAAVFIIIMYVMFLQ